MTEAKAHRGGDARLPKGGEADGWPGGRGAAGRAPPPKPTARPPVPPADRHAAITRTLYSYASYKLWADRVKDTWEPPASSAARDSKT